MRARVEPFGAWVRLDDGTLVAIDRSAAERLGLAGGAVWRDAETTRRTRPLEAHVAVTSRCGAGCKGCYLDARPDGESPPFEVITARLAALAAAGVFTVAFGGGEPLTRPDLGELGRAARRLGLVPVLTTSGIGMTNERAQELASFAQVNVSYDGEGAAYGEVRGWEGARVAERAMRLLAEAGVPFGINVVLTQKTFDALPETARRAASLGARELQLLRYKPAGRAADVSYLATRLSPAQVDALGPTLEALFAATNLAIRVDCSLVPLLSGHVRDAAALARFGVLGCEAGRYLAAVRIDGALAPCSFAPAADARAEDAWQGGASAAWATDTTLEAWRAPHDAEPCRSCEIRSVCRGGCRVVATHLGGALGPDPECPRVRAHRARTQSAEERTRAGGA
ncbi:radical SAM/SPASM domain-containing protein [Polyangium sorediatum]|uniref:Radical SAM protein n=1 Tax=Polyangium sorediatum TaxID=889274 RepID=A0ABT6NTU8_9BACT|nr:radical SAM protein [Polyangium sorediatum]MDI1431760.1 radical SAM protein [Polyangium sorediatum]